MAGRRKQPPAVDLTRAANLAHALGPWFDKAQRDLTWRRTRDPYAIWVSEIMLQQTRVETVERYYSDFLARFPTVQALADSDESDVLEAWSGLGYYRRARLLHKGARHVRDAFNGHVPQEGRDLLEVPGIGRYTAGAIASIAFDRPEPLVDGNVARVFSRVEGVEDVRQQGADAAGHWALAAAVLQHGRPRVLAQALMELGATVCTPKNVRCQDCPVREHCRAHARGLVEQIPAPKKRKASPVDKLYALAVVSRRRVLLIKRPAEGLLASMWCLPLLPVDATTLPPELSALGNIDASSLPKLADVRHVFTHRTWTIDVRRVDVSRRPSLGRDIEVAWVALDERPAGGVPAVTNKLLQRVFA